MLRISFRRLGAGVCSPAKTGFAKNVADDVDRWHAALATDPSPPIPPKAVERQIDEVACTMKDLQDILPLAAERVFGAAQGATLTAAEIALRTAFEKGVSLSQRSDAALLDDWRHSEMDLLSQRPAMVPVKLIKRRVHQLASLHFNQTLAFSSIAPTPIAESHFRLQKALSDKVPTFYEAIARDFGSIDGLVKQLRLFAMNHRADGWTWLVWNPKAKLPEVKKQPGSSTTAEAEESDKKKQPLLLAKTGRLEIFNSPELMTPLVVGLFPIIGIDARESAFLYAPKEWEDVSDRHGAGAADSPSIVHPKWSRAHRNPSAAATRPATCLLDRLMEPLEQQKGRRFDCVLSHLNWQFAAAQFLEAEQWFRSEERVKQQEAHKFDMDEGARQALLARLARRRGAQKSGDEEEQQQTAVAGDEKDAAAAAAEGGEPTDDAAAGGDGEAASPTAADDREKPAAKEAAPLAPDQALLTGTFEYSAEPEKSADGSMIYRRVDGTIEYRYDSGDKTIVAADGTMVWATKDLTTTRVKGNDQHLIYRYADGSVIEKTPDGRTKTTLADGTVMEE